MNTNEFFQQYPRVALGFSGGVDSSYLLYAAKQAGAEVKPYYIKTVFQPTFELDDAQRLASQLGVELTILELDILAQTAVMANPADRCYHCKTALFGALKERALEDGYSVLLDGTNASDQADDRPGMKALEELEVLSPLRLCGLTKSEVRELSREAGLFTWDKPAYACLATRVPAGRSLDSDLLHRVEAAEGALFRMGFSDFRVRVINHAARLQFPEDQLTVAFDQREAIITAIKPFFPSILLDLAGR